MNFTIITEQNCADLAEIDLIQRYKLDSKSILEKGNGYIKIEASAEKIVALCYTAQFAKRIILSLSEGKFKELEDLQSKIKKDLNKENLKLMSGKTIKCECERSGTHDFNSVEIENTMMDLIEDTKIDLKNPDNQIYFQIIDNEYATGIDLLKKDLSKRHYKLFNHNNAIKGTTAYNLLLFSDFKQKQIVIDPFSMSGVMVVEIALAKTKLPINFYDKLKIKNIKEFDEEMQEKIFKEIDKKINLESRQEIYSIDASFTNISAQKKNAKIAGVDKNIEFSKMPAEDIDLKIGENFADLIISRIIEPSKHISDAKAKRIYYDFLRHAKPTLKKNGKLTILARNPKLFEEEAKEQGYKKIKEKQIWQGKQPLMIVVFE